MFLQTEFFPNRESVHEKVFGEQTGLSMDIEELSAILEQYLDASYRLGVRVLIQVLLVGGKSDGRELYSQKLGGMGREDGEEISDSGELIGYLGRYADSAAQKGLGARLRISFSD